MKRTPLYEKHLELGGEIIDFGGWELPVQYTGIIQEHEQVRNAAGLFDVSHMGEITVKGPDAERFIQKIITNNILEAEPYKIVYSPMCYEDGGVVDDLLVYKYSAVNYLLIVNASNTEKDYEWIKQNIEERVIVENVSEHYAQIAIQGPKSGQILQGLTETKLDEIKFYHFIPDVKVGGINSTISRTGYTGEDGFEIYVDSKEAVKMWDILLKTGKTEGLLPAGLGARDTLRFEVGLPLYGHELTQEITPLEAGLGKFVKLDKEYFIGKKALQKQIEKGLMRKLVGFEMIDRGIPRSQFEVQKNGRNIGFVTSGSFSPTLKKNIGMALIETGYSAEGTQIDIVIRNKVLKASIVNLPFYSKKYKK